MRIKSAQAWWVQTPIETERQHVSDFGRLRSFDAAILRLETDDGLVGWGEGKNAAGSAGHYATLVHLLNHEFGPRIIGRDPADITFIWEDLYNGVRAEKSRAAGHAMPELARRGLTVAAISAIDIALWDMPLAAGRMPTISANSCRATSTKAASKPSRCASARWTANRISLPPASRPPERRLAPIST